MPARRKPIAAEADVNHKRWAPTGRQTRRTMRIVGLLFAALIAPATVDAQLVNEKDPCYLTLFGEYINPTMTMGSWDSFSDVALAAGVIRASFSWQLQLIKKAQADAATEYLTPATLERLREINRCLPWLRTLMGRLEAAMKRLGISTVVVPGHREAMAANALAEAVNQELAEAERLLALLLRPRLAAGPERQAGRFGTPGPGRGGSPIHAMAGSWKSR